MKKMFLVLVVVLLVACSAKPQTPEQWEAQQQEGVQEGFEQFLKDKQGEDQSAQEQAVKEAQVRPEVVEQQKTRVEVEIPKQLQEKYGSELSDCFEGYGSVEKVAAVASWCVTELAADNKDIMLCAQLLTGEGLDKCYQAVAKESGDAQLCQKISSDVIRMSCKEVLS